MTHHVTAMVVQGEAARYLAAKPERLDETLTHRVQAVVYAYRHGLVTYRLSGATRRRDGACRPIDEFRIVWRSQSAGPLAGSRTRT